MSALSRFLIVLVAVIFAWGVVMIFNTSSAEVLDHDLEMSTHHALIRHILYGFLGCVAASLIWVVGYRNFLSLSIPLLVLFTFFLVLTFVPGIGLSANGSNRWIRLGGYTLQPSEFVKYLIPAAFIQIMIRRGKQGDRFLSLPAFLKILGFLAVPMALIMLEPDNGTTGIIGITLIALFFLMRVPALYWVVPMLVLMMAGVVAAYHLPYVSSRIQVYLHPELDVRGRGHQPLQAKIAAGSGGLWGRGPGRSFQKMSYLPEAQNDYIAAIHAEEFGFAGMLLLITLYTSLAYLGFHIAFHAPDREGFFLAALITFLIAIQVFLNLGVVSGLLPSTGLNLPLFSQGGTSLMANIFAVGMLVYIAEAKDLCKNNLLHSNT